MKKFGYPTFDDQGCMLLTTYEGDYAHMMMDVRVYKLEAGQKKTFKRPEEEMAVLLLSGNITCHWEGKEKEISRRNVFEDGAWCLHVCKGTEVSVTADSPAEILVQCTYNDKQFDSRLYTPDDATPRYFSKGKYGNVANRRVSTIFDHDINPDSNMVIGEILNDKGNWSGYLPHKHPQPELYFFMFDRPDTGFGASFVGNDVYKIKDHSFAAIPGGNLHPQSAAPGYTMYTCWMIRHLPGRPWLQTDRGVPKEFLWLDENPYSAEEIGIKKDNQK